MAPADHAARRLIVNADDFGRSSDINRAIIQAHQHGILTSASLMVSGEAFGEAVDLARQSPKLGVGLHLTLALGNAALPPAEIPGLVQQHTRAFDSNPVRAGVRYFFQHSLRPQLRREIQAQLDKFHETGLPLDHVNGHLNIHLHPIVLSLLAELAAPSGIQSIRLTRDPFWLNARIASGNWLYRLSHAIVFSILSARAKPILQSKKVRFTDAVFGLLQTGRADERFVEQLLPRLPKGQFELYFHPSLNDPSGQTELNALISPKIRATIQREHIDLIRYQDLLC